eukprot:TRINITY_DN6734_c0_g1_i3.p1 TRINITY_DN6734_c0_g1~~TRINITY_DN6734_c0_g1_i3.p1  ORF type:complete len:292 (-),score=22.64 TRINITY_DN6734_c0_g1_i3:301-1176(-)
MNVCTCRRSLSLTRHPSSPIGSSTSFFQKKPTVPHTQQAARSVRRRLDANLLHSRNLSGQPSLLRRQRWPTIRNRDDPQASATKTRHTCATTALFHSNRRRFTTTTVGSKEQTATDFSGEGQVGGRGADVGVLREQILTLALDKHVKTYGWTVDALSVAAEELDHPGIVHGIVNNGASDLVMHFLTKCNRDLSTKIHELRLATEDKEQGIRITPRHLVSAALRWRLEMVVPYADTWSQALAVIAHPTQLSNSVQSLLNVVDEIWHVAGDTSTDLDWYAKRLMIAGVYASSG